MQIIGSVILASVVVLSVAEQDSARQLGFLHQEVAVADSQATLTVESSSDDLFPMNAGAAVEWKAESDLPRFLQYTLAGLWVAMITAVPFIIPYIDGRSPTRSQKVVGGVMLVVVFGGFYLFTNIILFQSVHFKKIRPLTVVECIYFMTQVITTVGYGDITPAKIRGQVFVGLYVIGALFVISMLISDLTNVCMHKAKEYKHKLSEAQERQDGREDSLESDTSIAESDTVKSVVAIKKPSLQPLLTALAVFAVIDIIWVSFFSMYPGENKTVFQAFYMSVITLSSVGFGWFTPLTEPGMVFGAFFMLFGCGALVNVITTFTELMLELNEWERQTKHHTAKSVKDSFNHAARELLKDHDENEELTEFQFLKFMLLHQNKVKNKEFECISRAFTNLNPSKGGLVALKDIKQSLDIHEEEGEENVAEAK